MNPSTLLVLLLVVDALLLAAHASGLVLRGEAFVIFNLDGESNIPAWWSSAKFVSAGALLAPLAVAQRFQRITPVLLCALFFALSADEATSLHERVGGVLEDLVAPAGAGARLDVFLWPLLLGIPVILVGLLVLRRLAKEGYLSAGVWRLYFLALGVFFAGAVGVELVAFNPVFPVGQESALYQCLMLLEEGLEHAGTSVLVWASLQALLERRGDLDLLTANR